MNTYNVKFKWNGREYIESVTCRSEYDAKKIIQAKYQGCYILRCDKAR